MKSFIFLFTLIYATLGFSQRDYRLVNKLNCDLVFQTYVVESASCNNIVSNVAYTLPAQSDLFFQAPPNTELRNIVAYFVVNNCVGMNLAAPTTSACANCPAPFGSSGSWTSTCNNACRGVTINYEWFEDCSGGATQLVYY